MLGYKFTTKEQAERALDEIDVFVRLPKGENNTQRWTTYRLANLNTPQFYYIVAHESFTELLGQPEELNVIFEEL